MQGNYFKVFFVVSNIMVYILFQTVISMHEALQKRRDLLFELGLTLQPLAVVIGEEEHPERFLVVIDDFFYEVESPLKAIDIVFKSFHALNLDYPPEAEQLWLFLQTKVYRITTRYDKHFTGVQSLGTMYEDFKKKLTGP